MRALAAALGLAAALVVVPAAPAHAVCYTDSGGQSYDSKVVSNDAGNASIRVKANGYWIVCGPPPSGSSITTSPEHLKASYSIVTQRGNLTWINYACDILNHDTPVDNYNGRVNSPDMSVNIQPATAGVQGPWSGTDMRYVCDVTVRWGQYAAGDDSFVLRGHQN